MKCYLKTFKLADETDESDFLLNDIRLDSACYSQNNIHPFRFFSQKRLSTIHFEPITVFCGGNGSGKSTLLNVIAEKLELDRSSPFNQTPFLKAYTDMCSYCLCDGVRLPKRSRIITSDDVFDFLLDIRSVNSGISKRREELFEEFYSEQAMSRAGVPVRMQTFDDYDKLKFRHEVNHSTASAYASRRMPQKEFSGRSNGESAYLYFTQEIRENALYLLDEPENSLSSRLQKELAEFLEESVRFYGCQLIISTHSPFLLSLKNAVIYDLDDVPVRTKRWTEIEDMRAYYELFKKNEELFL